MCAWCSMLHSGGGVCGQNICYHVAAFRDSLYIFMKFRYASTTTKAFLMRFYYASTALLPFLLRFVSF